MGDLKPLNDLCKIKLDSDEYGFGGEDKDTAESGILVELPDTFPHYGFNSFAFEVSLGAKDLLQDLHTYWSSKIGQRVFWTALAERGNVLTVGKERFAFVKLTSLIAEAEPETDAQNAHSDGAGAFKV